MTMSDDPGPLMSDADADAHADHDTAADPVEEPEPADLDDMFNNDTMRD
ncbi:MAG: hypothetical protein JWM93_2560 [Frankiales bacterium]|nr:hypothetical protein [Frankiales bacterium]